MQMNSLFLNLIILFKAAVGRKTCEHAFAQLAIFHRVSRYKSLVASLLSRHVCVSSPARCSPPPSLRFAVAPVMPFSFSLRVFVR